MQYNKNIPPVKGSTTTNLKVVGKNAINKLNLSVEFIVASVFKQLIDCFKGCYSILNFLKFNFHNI